MANNTNQGAAKKTRAPKTDKPAKVEKPVSETAQPKKTSKKPVRLTDTVRVESCFYGELVYISRKTGYKTVWNGFGSYDYLTVDDLMAMRNGQPAFFENQWIIITGENADDVIRFLQLEKYYKDISSLNDIDNLFRCNASELPGVLAHFSPAAKETIARRAFDLIEQKELTDINMIRALESATGFELT